MPRLPMITQREVRAVAAAQQTVAQQPHNLNKPQQLAGAGSARREREEEGTKEKSDGTEEEGRLRLRMKERKQGR